MDTIQTRLRLYLHKKGLSVNAFATNIGVPYSTLNSMLSRGTTPKQEFMDAISANSDINTEWLRSGEGQMLNDNRQADHSGNDKQTIGNSVNDSGEKNIPHKQQTPSAMQNKQNEQETSAVQALAEIAGELRIMMNECRCMVDESRRILKSSTELMSSSMSVLNDARSAYATIMQQHIDMQQLYTKMYGVQQEHISKSQTFLNKMQEHLDQSVANIKVLREELMDKIDSQTELIGKQNTKVISMYEENTEKIMKTCHTYKPNGEPTSGRELRMAE